MSYRRLAIVPARGGSKRIPGTNIRDFCGKPMMAHIIGAAHESSLFDDIHVSTDDESIRRVARDLGYEPEFLRSGDLADDVTPIMPVMKWVLEQYADMGRYYAEVFLLMPCAPLVEACDLIGASELFAAHGAATPVLAVTKYPAPVEWAYELSPTGKLVPVHPGKFAIRSQDLTAKFYHGGTFAVFPHEMISASAGPGDDSSFLGYVLPKFKTVDIDDLEDWALAETIFRGRLAVCEARSIKSESQ